jgi:SAM-dependent methyltransferase
MRRPSKLFVPQAAAWESPPNGRRVPVRPPAAVANPEDAARWDATIDEWFRQKTGPLWRVHADAVNVALLERLLGAAYFGRALKTDLFDEGVAEGLFPWLADHAGAVVGIDVSTDVVEAARRRYPELDARVADVRALPFADGDFDVVVSNSTLDHFDSKAELHQAIAEIARVLAPGGVLVLTLDNPLNPLVALRNALPFRWLHAVRLVPYYTGATCAPRPLRELLRRHGLEPGEQSSILHCPRAPAVALAGLLERSGGFGAGRYLTALSRFERLAALPTRYLTGYFIAVRAVKLRCGA